MTYSALRYSETGSLDVLRIDQLPEPSPGSGDVVVRVRAAGVNPFDLKSVSGFIPLETPFPRGVGGEFAGEVIAVGADAELHDGSRVAIGDHVVGWGAGAHAEVVVVPAGQLVRRPDGVPVEVAGALPVVAFTALALLQAAPVGDADTLLVGGASGGVGLVVAQLAARRGARVVGTASSRNLDLLASLGIEPVDYGEGVLERLRAAGPFTAAYDAHGRETLDAAVALGIPKDRIVAIAGYAAVAELGVVNVGRLRDMAALDGVLRLVATGDLVLPVAATHPLTSAAAAYEEVGRSHSPGKVVLVP